METYTSELLHKIAQDFSIANEEIKPCIEILENNLYRTKETLKTLTYEELTGKPFNFKILIAKEIIRRVTSVIKKE